MSAEIPYWWRVTPQIWVVLLIAGFVPFLEQKIHGLFKDFQEHFSHFWRTPFSAKKSLESVFFGSSTTWVILSQRSFCVCSFSLKFYLSYKFSIEIQGLSSTDCNFQGLSRCVRTLWLVMPHGQFASTNQKHHSDLGSHASSVWNFCAPFTDVISRGKQWRHCETSTVFSCYQQPQRNSIYFVT